MAGAGPEGYPDYQRERNVTGPVFLSAGPLELLKPLELPESPVKEVINYLSLSRFRAIMGWLAITKQAARVEIEYSRTPNRNTKIAELTPVTSIFTTPEIGNPTPFCIPVLAPFARILITPQTEGVKYHLQMSAWGSDQLTPNLWLPTNTLLIPDTNVKVAAGKSATFYPANYYAGGISLYTGNSQKSTFIELQAQVGLGEWARFWAAEFTAFNQALFTTVPNTAWRAVLFNSAAAEAEMQIAAVASYGNPT